MKKIFVVVPLALSIILAACDKTPASVVVVPPTAAPAPAVADVPRAAEATLWVQDRPMPKPRPKDPHHF